MDISALANSAVESDDLTKSQSFVRELPRAGVALFRLRDYIETGRHESPNPAYKPALKVMMVFELLHPDHLTEIGGEKVPMTVTVRVNKGTTAKSGYKKLFNVMNDAAGGGKQHFVQMIGQPFLGELFHNVVGAGDKAKTYVNIDKDGAWSLKAPVQVDAINNTSTTIPVPELHGTPRVFLWENKSLTEAQVTEMWDTLFIDGTRQDKDGVEVSKNWIQEVIKGNLEWVGSITQGVVEADNADLADALDVPFEEPAKEEPTKAEPAADDLASLALAAG